MYLTFFAARETAFPRVSTFKAFERAAPRLMKMISREVLLPNISTSPLRCVSKAGIFVYFACFCRKRQENALRT